MHIVIFIAKNNSIQSEEKQNSVTRSCSLTYSLRWEIPFGTDVLSPVAMVNIFKRPHAFNIWDLE